MSRQTASSKEDPVQMHDLQKVTGGKPGTYSFRNKSARLAGILRRRRLPMRHINLDFSEEGIQYVIDGLTEAGFLGN